VYDPTLPIDMSDYIYVQSPECGYPYTAVYTWTGTGNAGDPITIDGNISGNTGSIVNVYSMKPTDEGPYTLSVSAELSIANNNNVASTFTMD
jgi:hypothetical protein